MCDDVYSKVSMTARYIGSEPNSVPASEAFSHCEYCGLPIVVSTISSECRKNDRGVRFMQ